MRQRKKEGKQQSSSSGLSTEAKAAKLREILDRVARRERDDADRANEEAMAKQRMDEA